jgi:hypothetical protein
VNDQILIEKIIITWEEGVSQSIKKTQYLMHQEVP